MKFLKIFLHFLVNSVNIVKAISTMQVVEFISYQYIQVWYMFYSYFKHRIQMYWPKTLFWTTFNSIIPMEIEECILEYVNFKNWKPMCDTCFIGRFLQRIQIYWPNGPNYQHCQLHYIVMDWGVHGNRVHQLLKLKNMYVKHVL